MDISTGNRDRRYGLFGLQIRSELLLPELFESVADRPPDILIRAGEVPAPHLLSPGVHQLGSDAVLVVPDCGRYLIRGGSEIVVEPDGGASEKNVRLFLLGSAFGLLLHQRKLLPLHANAVEIGGEATMFMGPSGVGKSTLAAWFHDHGYRIVADDVSVVTFDDVGIPYVQPGLPRLRLCEDILPATGRSPDNFRLSFTGDDEYRKRDVHIARPEAVDRETRVASVVLLQNEESDLIRLRGAASVDALFSNTYRGQFVGLTNGVQDHWIGCTALANTVPIYEVGLRGSLSQLDESCERLIRQLHALA